jgi:hypothetical protein
MSDQELAKVIRSIVARADASASPVRVPVTDVVRTALLRAVVLLDGDR